ncbi:MAG: isoprenylcysteine carboxylmethyltransferase family protein [Gemmatimonadaceae bacterium]
MTTALPPRQRDGAGVRFPPPLLYAVPLGIGYFLQRTWPMALVPHSAERAAETAGVVLLVAWLALMLSAFGLFRRAGTNIIPNRPTTAIVVAGPYRFTRNPMYVSMTLGYIGACLFGNTLWPLIFLPFILVAVRRLVIDREEQYLERKFGDEYRAYCARVRRWL